MTSIPNISNQSQDNRGFIGIFILLFLVIAIFITAYLVSNRNQNFDQRSKASELKTGANKLRSAKCKLLVPRTNIGGPFDPNYYNNWKHTDSLPLVEADLKDMTNKVGTKGKGDTCLGFNAEVLYLDQPIDEVAATIDGYFNLARSYNMPLVLQMTDVIWWGNRPDLWNWFDPVKPGYNPTNIENVEYSCFDQSCASKDTWRYWLTWIHNGFPAPNYESLGVRTELASRIKQLAPTINKNIQALQQEEKDYLFAGLQIGGETSYGHWTCDNTNFTICYGYRAYLDLTCPSTNPNCQTGSTQPADWGEVQTKVFQRFDEFLAKDWLEAGIPKEKIYSHAGVTSASFNGYSLPAWSFYGNSSSVTDDIGNALKNNGNPSWGVGENNPLDYSYEGWTKNLNNLLQNPDLPNVKMVAISNWGSPNVKDNEDTIRAIRNVLGLYEASLDYANKQSNSGWSFIDSASASMFYDSRAKLWYSIDGGFIGKGISHPGKTTDTIRRFKAPKSGVIQISGSASDKDGKCGDGVIVYIMKGSSDELWKETIQNGNTQGYTFNLTTGVAEGDTIDFAVNRIKNVFCDTTEFKTKLEYISISS